MANLHINNADSVLKIKNGMAGTYHFSYRHPVNNKLITLPIPPFATAPIYTGELDDCSKVRLQYPAIPDNGEAKLSDSAIQFVWENELPNLDDYLGSLEVAENAASQEAAVKMNEAIEEVALNLPNENSKIEIATVGKKKTVKAQGRELN